MHQAIFPVQPIKIKMKTFPPTTHQLQLLGRFILLNVEGLARLDTTQHADQSFLYALTFGHLHRDVFFGFR